MSERIRSLEEALAESHSSASQESHPLLDPELLLIKAGVERYSEGLEVPKHHQESEQVESQGPSSVPSPSSTPIPIQLASAIDIDDSDEKMPPSPAPLLKGSSMISNSVGRQVLVADSRPVLNPVQVASGNDDPDQKLASILCCDINTLMQS
jgi:hypothetical protein